MRVVRSVRLVSLILGLLSAAAPAALFAQSQPVDAPLISLDDLHAGQAGEVWTVFEGNKSEPFAVEVTGVIRNALGPGKSLILCKLTDPRVQNMGAVAGMSGSPLYIDGKLAGALSYQIQRFETVRYAGFTPIADLLEVSQYDKGDHHVPSPGGYIPLERQETRSKTSTERSAMSATPRSDGDLNGFSPLTPVFALGGISPAVSSLFDERFHALGLNVTAMGGSTTSGPATSADIAEAKHLAPGSAVAVALATGDVTVAGTGTVSHVEGDRILAFGHPLMGLGNVDLPMALAEIIAILPSSLNSFKISNTGAVVGTISQDRLSAIYGEVGRTPEMLPIEVKTPNRTLHFNSVRHVRLTPMIAAMGLSQAVMGSNENGLAEGFRIISSITYPDGQSLNSDTVYAGPQGFSAGLDGFIHRLTGELQNPIADIFPRSIAFTVEPLDHNPVASLDSFQLSRTRIQVGENLTATLSVRDFQGQPVREVVQIPMRAEWLGKKIELIVTSGDDLDKLTGHPDSASVAQIRSFNSYLDLLRRERRDDGLYIAVVEHASGFVDQAQTTLDYPGSYERIARTSDEARFQKREVLVPLWETHVLPGKLIDSTIRRPLQIVE